MKQSTGAINASKVLVAIMERPSYWTTTVSDLVRHSGLSRRTVQFALNRLVDAGEVVYDERGYHASVTDESA